MSRAHSCNTSTFFSGTQVPSEKLTEDQRRQREALLEAAAEKDKNQLNIANKEFDEFEEMV